MSASAKRTLSAAPRMTEAQMVALLRERYSVPEWAGLEQLRNGTGFSRPTTRTADFVAFNLYPSRGLAVIGHEVKVSRSDWLREKKEPEKAEEFIRFCTSWYIVAPDPSIVAPGELPLGWGLLCPRGGKGLAVVKQAEERKPLEPTRTFVAAIMRNVHEHYTSAPVLAEMAKAGIDEALTRAKREWDAGHSGTFTRMQRELEELKERVAVFEKASGVSIGHRWEVGPIGAAVRLVKDGGLPAVAERAKRMQTQLVDLAGELDKLLKDPALGNLTEP